jgi:hypothetical protein
MIRLANFRYRHIKKNGVLWTTELMTALGAGAKLSDAHNARYNHREIKECLLKETHGKCAYCDGKLSHVTYGGVAPERTFDWANLTVACDICNTKKGELKVW